MVESRVDGFGWAGSIILFARLIWVDLFGGREGLQRRLCCARRNDFGKVDLPM